MVKIIEPSVEIVSEINSDKMLKQIEKCARNCYKSENNITEDTTSAVKMIGKLIEMGHTAMIEFADVIVNLHCDVGVYKDLTRHRHCSFAIESTRYCNYSKGKFGNEISVIKPCNMDENSGIYHTWLKAMNDMERAYMQMAEIGATPDQLRMILPHSTAASVMMKANVREWRHIFNLRCAKAAHPSVRQIMLMTLNEFHNKIPVLFDDLYEQFKFDIDDVNNKKD
jgi:thymidylate synthase (FAD)|uniref:Thymidylate synthase complementing protein n=1 Tax=Myoviridae sp. ctWb16 TaxID=2827690 RepID=A0A8S5T0P1_9CAUD|nr:MAG TPA: Thymidylate synthase complementing protein [Myoviridae sp. ctWb16]